MSSDEEGPEPCTKGELSPARAVILRKLPGMKFVVSVETLSSDEIVSNETSQKP